MSRHIKHGLSEIEDGWEPFGIEPVVETAYNAHRYRVWVKRRKVEDV